MATISLKSTCLLQHPKRFQTRSPSSPHKSPQTLRVKSSSSSITVMAALARSQTLGISETFTALREQKKAPTSHHSKRYPEVGVQLNGHGGLRVDSFIAEDPENKIHTDISPWFMWHRTRASGLDNNDIQELGENEREGSGYSRLCMVSRRS
ncbi:hypothetical protein AKJ16_DCAP01934 [Drosera capensis]